MEMSELMLVPEGIELAGATRRPRWSPRIRPEDDAPCSKLFDDVHKAADQSVREIARLRVRVLQLTQRAFGKSSEKIDPNQLRLIREEVSERLDYRPASLLVVQDITEVYGCTCGESKPVTTEMPSRVIEGGVPEPGLLAHVAEGV